jgi:hypothetical protein
MIFVLTPGAKISVLSGEYSFVVNSVLQRHKSAVSTNRPSAPLKRFDMHCSESALILFNVTLMDLRNYNSTLAADQ